MTPLFIVGVPRSGTTLMRSLMQVFDRVYLPPDEFQLLPFILSSNLSTERLDTVLRTSNFADHMRRRNLWPDDACLEEIVKKADGPSVFQSLVLGIARKDKKLNPTYWGDKTPENLFHLDAIFATWPDARIIHVIRDPRSTVFSMKKSWGRSLTRSSVVWRDGVNAISRHKAGQNRDRIFEFRYETLTSDPASEIGKLAKWLNLPFDPSDLNDIQTEERWSTAKLSGIQQRGAAWDRPEYATDAKIIESICFDAMALAGYAPKYATAAMEPSKVALKLAKGADGWRVLRSYANERGWASAVYYKLRQWRTSRLR